VADLPKLGAPATRALLAAGYTELTQLAGVSLRELQKLHGVGPKALRIIEEALAERGLTFRE
jgi:DNA integrity scanning protein DisA with diadenylate cyclase activity